MSAITHEGAIAEAAAWIDLVGSRSNIDVEDFLVELRAGENCHGLADAILMVTKTEQDGWRQFEAVRSFLVSRMIMNRDTPKQRQHYTLPPPSRRAPSPYDIPESWIRSFYDKCKKSVSDRALCLGTFLYFDTCDCAHPRDDRLFGNFGRADGRRSNYYPQCQDYYHLITHMWVETTSADSRSLLGTARLSSDYRTIVNSIPLRALVEPRAVYAEAPARSFLEVEIKDLEPSQSGLLTVYLTGWQVRVIR